MNAGNFNATKVFLAGAVLASYGWLLLSYLNGKSGRVTGVPFYSCVADPKGVAEQLCKCANCGMK